MYITTEIEIRAGVHKSTGFPIVKLVTVRTDSPSSDEELAAMSAEDRHYHDYLLRRAHACDVAIQRLDLGNRKELDTIDPGDWETSISRMEALIEDLTPTDQKRFAVAPSRPRGSQVPDLEAAGGPEMSLYALEESAYQAMFSLDLTCPLPLGGEWCAYRLRDSGAGLWENLSTKDD